MKISLRKIVEVCNSEGEIITILKEKSDTLYIMAKTNNGRTNIITKTNHFQISLYLQSRIVLKELFLMNQDTHYFLITGDNAEAVFFEIKPNNLPPEIQGLECGNELYHLISPDMRTSLNSEEIFDLLPDPLSNERPQAITDTIDINLTGVDFFNSEKSPIRIISIDSYNPDEHDYLMCPTEYGKESILVKINPSILFLFLQNRLSVSEVYKCRMDDYYIIREGEKFYRSKYNSYIESILKQLSYNNYTYYSLPRTIRVDNPIQKWKYYNDNITISGKGVLPENFQKRYDLDIRIIKNK